MKLVSIIVLLLMSTSAFSALPNTFRDVGKIDVTKGSVIIWIEAGLYSQDKGCSDTNKGHCIDNEMYFQPESCNQYKAISCPITEPYCKLMSTVALAAKMSSKRVEFTFSGSCNGSFADVNRFRMMNE